MFFALWQIFLSSWHHSMPWLTSNGGGLWLLFTLVEFTPLLWIVKYAIKRDMIPYLVDFTSFGHDGDG